MRLAIAFLLGILLLATSAWSETRIFLGSAICLRTEMPVLQPFTVGILAITFNGSFSAAEFAVEGFTAERGFQILEVAPNPRASVALGNPFAEGARIAFDECQGDPTKYEPVVLYTATVLALRPFELDFPVTAHSIPGNPSLQCPQVVECSDGSPGLSVACGYPSPPSYVEHLEAPPHSPTPADGATNVPVEFNCSLGWQGSIDCNCLGDWCFKLWFGQDPDPPFYGVGNCGFDPLPNPRLQPSTRYYWRVEIINCGSGTSPVWSFTTAPPIAVDAATWGRVKQLYR